MTMSVQEAIRARRTIKEYRPDPVPRQLIETVLQAAAWAPNHHLTQPWRFIVLEGAARIPLAELRRALKRRELREKGAPPDQVEAEAAESGAKLLRAPVLIVVACQQIGDTVRREEDYSATAAAIQNMLLAATELGLGTFWTSGPLALAPETNALFDLDPSDRIVGIIHLGFPAETPAPTHRPPPPTRWIAPHEVPKLVGRIERLVNGGVG
ncbi:MAG: nitroreductase [Chloroflexota bacterium]|nr:nitroreductase [Dehalococcoidia bacterium]MDW8254356.1 nitroreductase [Chloroflexota bacterium]